MEAYDIFHRDSHAAQKGGKPFPGQSEKMFPSCLQSGSAHSYNYVILFLSRHIRHNASFYSLSVHGEGFHALFYVVRIDYLNVVCAFAEFAGQGKITEPIRYTGINAEPLVRGVHAENVL